MKEIRCPKCNQLLLKADFCIGEIKCTRCKKIVKIDMKKDRVSNTTRNSE
jgi:phage FluMu protein Com